MITEVVKLHRAFFGKLQLPHSVAPQVLQDGIERNRPASARHHDVSSRLDLRRVQSGVSELAMMPQAWRKFTGYLVVITTSMSSRRGSGTTKVEEAMQNANVRWWCGEEKSPDQEIAQGNRGVQVRKLALKVIEYRDGIWSGHRQSG